MAEPCCRSGLWPGIEPIGPDYSEGSEQVAFVIERTPGAVDTEAVREFCHGKIAHFKIPRYVMPVGQTARSSNQMV
jgi:acyl-CoA synthetase (AMP-forming)/AMP-acid ligase II